MNECSRYDSDEMNVLRLNTKSALFFVTQRGCVESVVVSRPGMTNIQCGKEHEVAKVLSTWVWSTACDNLTTECQIATVFCDHRTISICFFSRSSALRVMPRVGSASTRVTDELFSFYFEDKQVT